MRLTKRHLTMLVTALLTAAMAALGIVAATGTAQASTTRNFLVTLYGWPDNSPPGNDIAYPASDGNPTLHNAAGGTGTYANPITYATDESELAVGTIVYYSYLHRYFIMEDDCVECDQDWSGSGSYHIDLWIGGQGGNSNDVINCEDDLTQDSAPVIVDPPSNEPVDTTPLFNSSTNACYNPAGFTGGGGGGGTTPPPGGSTGPVTGYQGLCLDDRSASTANYNPIQVYTCNGTTAQSWTAESNGSLEVLGKCLDVDAAGTANGTKVDLYSCNGTGAQVWQHQSNGELLNPASGKCLDDTGYGAAGTQVQIWSCTGTSNQDWTVP
ncbi:ricin-type beta-trefoil lectin domain protein [Actinospica robiniae]|uniref:ricin-type beta-trefoil lectin domain protein n=1 Tax=Actinospica robiniae TaxID=304901 RepID=UPI0003FA701F|nr:ricin-type beta-trefoil lectin domain protein [Actinospica robiniae]